MYYVFRVFKKLLLGVDIIQQKRKKIQDSKFKRRLIKILLPKDCFNCFI
jgi:hypothetical protein